jgi:cytochrome P450
MTTSAPINSQTPIHPKGPKGFGLLSSLPRLAKDPFGYCMSEAAKGDGLVRLGSGPASAYLISHPDYVHHVLIDNPKNYIKGSIMDGIRYALGNGLFTAEGDHWKRQRKLMQPAFYPKQIEKIASIVNEEVQEAAQRWEKCITEQMPLDMLTDATQTNVQVVLKSLLGTSIDPEQSERLVELTNEVFQGMTKRVWTFFVPSWLPTPGKSAYRRAIAQLDQEIYSIIIQRRQSSEPKKDDLLSVLLDSKDENGQFMTDQQIRDEVFTIFLAGYESTASSVTWASYLLSQNSAIADRLYEEVNRVLKGRIPNYMDLMELKYARMVLNETLRLYPAFPMYFRTSVEDDIVGNYVIRGNSAVILSPYATHHDPRFWSDPEKFDPDRFSPERFDSTARRAYYPFGKGQRSCIGQDMSLATALIMIVAFVQKYEFSLVPNKNVNPRYAMTYQPLEMPFHLKRRND